MRKLRAGPLAAAVLAAAISACATAEATVSAEGHTSSPWEFGPSIRMTYPVRIGTGLTVNPMASYTYLSYDGGHENRFDFGAQLRKSMGRAGGPPGFWIGAEGAYAFLKDEFDGGSEDYDGWSLTALVGVPLVQNKLNPHIVGGAGISGYGSGTGKNVRLGVSVTPF